MRADSTTVPFENDRRARLSLGAAYAALFVTIGVYLPFFPLFLAGRGLGPEAIGLALAIPIVTRIIALPVAGIVSDRSGWPREFLVALGFFSALGFALIGVAPGTAAILAALAIASAFWNPVFPLLESYAVRLAALGRLDYGRARLWGSIAFVAANLGAGVALDVLPDDAVVWAIAAAILSFALVAVLMPKLPAAPPAAAEGAPAPGRIALMLGVAAAALVQASHAVLYAFASLHWAAAGLSSLTIGALWAIGVVAEIVLFVYASRALKAAPALAMLTIGGSAAAVRFGALAFDPPTALLFPLQLLHGLSFGATHLGLMALIAERVPVRAAGRAQAYSSAAIAVVLALATVAAGPLYAAFGAAAFASSAVLGALGAALALIARLSPRVAGRAGR